MCYCQRLGHDGATYLQSLAGMDIPVGRYHGMKLCTSCSLSKHQYERLQELPSWAHASDFTACSFPCSKSTNAHFNERTASLVGRPCQTVRTHACLAYMEKGCQAVRHALPFVV